MFISKRQLRQDKQLLELALKNTKYQGDITGNLDRKKVFIQRYSDFIKALRLNDRLLSNCFISKSEKEFYISNTNFFTNVA